MPSIARDRLNFFYLNLGHFLEKLDETKTVQQIVEEAVQGTVDLLKAPGSDSCK